MSVNELREIASSEGVGSGSSRKLSALEREREGFAAFDRRRKALAEQNAAFASRLSESDATGTQADAQTESNTTTLNEVFAERQRDFRRERARERRERRTKRIESLYESIDTVHEKLSGADRERFLSATNATIDPRETRARAVNMRHIATHFKQFRKTIESGDAVAYGSIRAAVAVRLFATDAEREAIENARDESERAAALKRFTEMTDVEFYERQGARIAQRTERENVSNSVLLAVRDAVFKSRGASADIDALEIYRAARGELIDARARSGADGTNAQSSALQFNAAELDELRKQSLVAAERAKRDRESINDTVEMLLRVFARDRNAGTVNETSGEYGDESVDGAIERLAQHSDDERSLIYYTLGLRAEDAPETEKARGRGWAMKLSEKMRRSFRDIARSHIENFEQSGLNERMQIAERLKRGERVTTYEEGTFYRGKEMFASDDEKRRFIADTERDWRMYRAAVEMEGVVDGTIDPAHFDNKWINALAEGPGQVAFMAQAAIGGPVIGMALTASTIKALRTKELVMRGVPLQQATTIASVSAVPEALIERLQLNMLIGRGAAGRFIGNLVTEPTAKALGKRAAVAFGADVVMQTAQEQLQDAMPLAIQHIASWLDDKVPASTVEDWKELGASTPEVAVMMLIPVLLGTGAGVFRDRSAARQHMASEQVWRAAGFKEEVVQEITELVRVDKMREAQALVQQNWNDAAKRKARTAEQIEAIEELEEALRAGGEMLAEHDITIDEEGIFTVRDRNGEVVDRAATPEAAIELARAVNERERAADEAKRAEEEANAEPEVAGFETQHERVERNEAEAQEASQRSAEVQGMPLAEESKGEQAEAAVDPEVAAKLEAVISSAGEDYEGPRRKEVIGLVSEEVAAVVAEALGIDASGYRHSIDTNAVKHIFDRHGKKRERRERARGQIPITAEDIKHIPLILASPDRVDYTGKTDRGHDAFMYRKRMPDGTVFYLEEVHSQNGELAAKTLYKKENPAGENVPVANHSPFPNVRNGSGDKGDGAQQPTDVKPLGSPLGQGRPNAARVSYEGEQGTPEVLGAAGRSGILRTVPPKYVGEGRGTVVLTPDASQRRDALAAQEPVVIESNLSEDVEKAKAEAETAFRALERRVTNRQSGREIELVMNGFRKLRSHIGNQRVLKIVPHLKELIENATPLFENTGDGKHWHHYGAAAVIDGEPFFVRLVAFEGNNRKLQLDVFHDAQVSPRETVEGLTSPSRSQVTNEDARSRGPSKELLVHWWQLVKEQDEADAKAREERPLQDLLDEGNSEQEGNELGSPLGLGRKNAQATSFAGEAGALAKRKGKPVTAPEVLDALAAIIETVGGSAKGMNRTGRIRGRRYAGVYLVREKITRIREANNVGTAAHELAHAIDGQLWNYGHWAGNALGLSNGARRELYRLGVDLYGRTKPKGGYYSEGFAEFIRLWLTDRKLAKKLAPNFAEYWAGELAARSELNRAMEEASELAHAWYAQGSRSRSSSGIVATPTNAQRAVSVANEQWREKYKNWVESAAAIQAFTEEAMARSRSWELDDSMNPYLTLTARRLTADSVVAYMAEEGMIDFAGNKTGGAPLAEAFKLVGKSKAEDFLIYLWAKRAVALWDDRRNGPRNAGLDIADARYLVETLESPQFERAAQIVYEWNRGVLNYAAEASPALARVVRKIRQIDPGFYIPLQREFEAFDQRYKGSGSGSAARAQLMKRLRGSGRRIKDPVESMIAQAKNIVLRAQQRRIIDQIIQIARTTDGMGHYVVEVPVDQVPKAQASVADLLSLIDRKFKQYTGKEAIELRAPRSQVEAQEMANILEEATVTLFGPANEPKQGESPIFPVWDGGKMRWYELDQELYAALSGMDTYRLGPVLDLLFGKPARALRLGTTGLRASFSLVTNPLRDLRTLHLNSRASANSGELFMSWMGTLKESFLYSVSNGKISSEWMDLAHRWGLEMAQPLGQDSQPLVRTARRIKNGGEWSPFSAGDWYDWIKQVLQFTELSSRVTEMKLVAKDLGWDVSQPVTEEIMQKLMQAGKRATTDFTQAGAYARAINQAVPFFNAAIQGPVAHIRALKANPSKFMMRGLAMTAFALANWFRNKDEDWWKEMPLSERYGFTYIPLPNGDLLRIPRAFEADGIFMAGAEALVDAWYAEDPKAVIGWFKEWLGSVVPDALPVPVKWAREQYANKDYFRDRPIIPRGQQDMPEAEQYGPYTSRVAIKLGGLFGVSPARIDHAVRSFFGGVGTDLVGLLGRGNSDLIDREWEAADTPVFGTLFQRGGQRPMSSKSVDAMYDAYTEALKRQKSRIYEETPLEKQQRLMLQDAVRAVAIYGDVKLFTKSKEARAELEREQAAIAREVVELLKIGEADRSVGKRAKAKAEGEQRKTLRELNVTPDRKTKRPLKKLSVAIEPN